MLSERLCWSADWPGWQVRYSTSPPTLPAPRSASRSWVRAASSPAPAEALKTLRAAAPGPAVPGLQRGWFLEPSVRRNAQVFEDLGAAAALLGALFGTASCASVDAAS